MHPVYAAMPMTIFEQVSQRARETGAINLGQGFPDSKGPPSLLRAAADALLERSNQYPPMLGLPELRAAVASHYRRHQGVAYDPEQVVITSGATEALAATILAIVSPGDEVILLPPLYDLYRPMVERAGGTPVFVPLAPPDWRIDPAALEAAVSPATRAIILNNPLNPSGSTASAAEIDAIAALCCKHDLLAISDEVWEHVRYDGAVHLPLAASDGMAERTIKVGSAGKIFSLTGWKVGWLCAPPALAPVIARAHQFLTFTTPPNLQWAVTQGLEQEDAWIRSSVAGFQVGRDRLAAGLGAIGLRTLPSAATYFLCIDLAASGVTMADVAFCDWMIERGVAGIPVSAFYPQAEITHLVRLCFAKEDATIDEAVSRLNRAFER